MSDFELAEHEKLILTQAAHMADTCEQLQEIINREGAMIAARDGGLRTHPACRELRQQRAALARIIVALRVPLGDESTRTGQYRGLRGAYTLAGEG